MRTYGWQNISKMPKEELIEKIHILISDQLCEVLMDKSYPAETYIQSKKEEVEIVRSNKMIDLLPEEEKQKVYEKCDKALKMVDAYGLIYGK